MTHHHSASACCAAPAILLPMSQSPSTTLMPFSSLSPSPHHSTTLPQPSQSGAQPHESLASQFKAGLSHLSLHAYKIPPPLSPRSSSLRFFTLFPGQISPRQQGPWQGNNYKKAVLRLIDRLARHAMQSARKEGYIKIATIFGHISDARTSWMADVFVSSINTDYINKLNWSSSPSLPFLIPST